MTDKCGNRRKPYWQLISQLNYRFTGWMTSLRSDAAPIMNPGQDRPTNQNWRFNNGTPSTAVTIFTHFPADRGFIVRLVAGFTFYLHSHPVSISLFRYIWAWNIFGFVSCSRSPGACVMYRVRVSAPFRGPAPWTGRLFTGTRACGMTELRSDRALRVRALMFNSITNLHFRRKHVFITRGCGSKRWFELCSAYWFSPACCITDKQTQCYSLCNFHSVIFLSGGYRYF